LPALFEGLYPSPLSGWGNERGDHDLAPQSRFLP
jgi:hypothetical protein